MSPTRKELERRFNHHSPSEEGCANLSRMRAACLELALSIVAVVPYSREQSLALTDLETTMFWANAGIARPKV